MSNYHPDRWLVVKINSDQPHYRVFGTWSGGYTTGASWKLNSGITKISEEGQYYNFEGSSGSVYECNKSSYGATAYGYGVLMQMIKDSAEVNKVDIEILPEETNFMEINYE